MEAQEKTIIFLHSSKPWKGQWKVWICCCQDRKRKKGGGEGKLTESAKGDAVLSNQRMNKMSKISDF